MTEDKAPSALDDFIATFKPDRSEPKSQKSQSHEGETYSNRESNKKTGEIFSETSRVKSLIRKRTGSTGSKIYKPLDFPNFPGASRSQLSQSGPAEPSTALDRARLKREMRWALDHGMRLPRDMCAGCRRPIAPGEAFLDLADDNRVHFPSGAAGYDCLIAWGECWRGAVRQALAHFDRGPWGTSLDLHPASQTAADTRAHPDKTTDKPRRAPGSMSASTPCPEKGIES